jgi:hypothetical protein
MHLKFSIPLGLALLAAGCGRLPQSTQCQAFVTCVKALDAADGQPTNVDRFLDTGVCWRNEATADGCTTGCQSGLDRLRARSPALPAECAP